jgi:hypothetical protein
MSAKVQPRQHANVVSYRLVSPGTHVLVIWPSVVRVACPILVSRSSDGIVLVRG